MNMAAHIVIVDFIWPPKMFAKNLKKDVYDIKEENALIVTLISDWREVHALLKDVKKLMVWTVRGVRRNMIWLEEHAS